MAGAPGAPQPVELFYSYSHKDQGLRGELNKHLKLLERQGVITGCGMTVRLGRAPALRHFFDKCVVRHAMMLNPALSVRGPKLKMVEGKTPAITPQQAEHVLESINAATPVGKRDRAALGTFIWTARRAGAIAKLQMRHYFTDGKGWFLRFDEKGGKQDLVACRYDLQIYLDEYIEAPGIVGDEPSSPLFRVLRQNLWVDFLRHGSRVR